MVIRNRKETAWRKNRKFGDVHGGRMSPKLADNVFRRAHSLQPPADDADLPIVIEENPSRDFFFPLSGDEARMALLALPKREVKGVTHLWLRRVRKTDYKRGEQVVDLSSVCRCGERKQIEVDRQTVGVLLRRLNGRELGNHERGCKRHHVAFLCHQSIGW